MQKLTLADQEGSYRSQEQTCRLAPKGYQGGSEAVSG